MPLPQFEHGELTVATLRKASQYLSAQRIRSYRDQAFLLNGEKHSGTSEDAVAKFAANKTTPHGLEDFCRKLWKMMAEHHPTELQRVWEEVQREAIVQRDPVTNALHQFWVPEQPFDHSRLRKLAGNYAAYTHHIAAEGMVMQMALQCEVDGDPGRFTLDMIYENDMGEILPNTVEGSIIPYEANIMFVGRIRGQTAPYIFAFSRVEVRNDQVKRAEGALLAASNDVLPRASAIVIIQREQCPEPASLTDTDIETVLEKVAIRKALARGKVDWRD